MVQFTRWTNADYSNVVPALQPAVLPLRVARAQLAKLHRDEREMSANGVADLSAVAKAGKDS